MTIKLRCPKCRGQNMTVTSSQVKEVVQFVEAGKVTSSWSNGGGMSEVLRVDGCCNSCGHDWRLRDVNGWDEESGNV